MERPDPLRKSFWDFLNEFVEFYGQLGRRIQMPKGFLRRVDVLLRMLFGWRRKSPTQKLQHFSPEKQFLRLGLTGRCSSNYLQFWGCQERYTCDNADAAFASNEKLLKIEASVVFP